MQDASTGRSTARARCLWQHRSSVADRLRVDTQLLRRALWSGAATAAPVAASDKLAYGDEDRVLDEVRVGLAELLAGAPPHQVTRHLLPAGIELRTVELAIALPDRPPRIAGPWPLAATVIVVPERGSNPGDAVRGHWVFAPTLGHTFFARRADDLDARIKAELGRIVVAHAPDGEGWRRLLPAEVDELIEAEILIAGPEPAKGTRILEAEQRRRAEETLQSIGGHLAERARPGEDVVGRDRELAAIDALLAAGPGKSAALRGSVLVTGEEAVGKTAVIVGWGT